MKLLRYLIPLALFGVLAAFLMRGLSLDPREVPSPLVGKPAPAFALAQLDDASKIVKREDLLGKPWLLNVWASWCTPCREEHPRVVAFAKHSGVPVYGLNYKDTKAAAQAWLQQLGNPYVATLVDADGRTGIDWGVYGVPETYVIDRAGVIRFKQIGPVTAEVLNERIVPLLRELQRS